MVTSSPTLSSYMSSSSSSASQFTKNPLSSTSLEDRIASSDKSNKISPVNSSGQQSINGNSKNSSINDTITLNGPENHDEVALVFWFKGLYGTPLFTLDFSSSRGSPPLTSLAGGNNYKIQSHLKSSSPESSRIFIENAFPSRFIGRNKSRSESTKRGGDPSKWSIPSLAINPVTFEDDSDYRYVNVTSFVFGSC